MPNENTNPDDSGIAQIQYEALREVNLSLLKETWTLERVALVAIAAFWAWLFSREAWRPWMDVARFIPAALALFVALRMLRAVGGDAFSFKPPSWNRICPGSASRARRNPSASKSVSALGRRGVLDTALLGISLDRLLFRAVLANREHD
jgi:hypothetical protein